MSWSWISNHFPCCSSLTHSTLTPTPLSTHAILQRQFSISTVWKWKHTDTHTKARASNTPIELHVDIVSSATRAWTRLDQWAWAHIRHIVSIRFIYRLTQKYCIAFDTRYYQKAYPKLEKTLVSVCRCLYTFVCEKNRRTELIAQYTVYNKLQWTNGVVEAA